MKGSLLKKYSSIFSSMQYNYAWFSSQRRITIGRPGQLRSNPRLLEDSLMEQYHTSVQLTFAKLKVSLQLASLPGRCWS